MNVKPTQCLIVVFTLPLLVKYSDLQPSIRQRSHQNRMSFKQWSCSYWLWSTWSQTLYFTTQDTSLWPTSEKRLLRNKVFRKSNSQIFYFIHFHALSKFAFHANVGNLHGMTHITMVIDILICHDVNIVVMITQTWTLLKGLTATSARSAWRLPMVLGSIWTLYLFILLV